MFWVFNLHFHSIVKFYSFFSIFSLHFVGGGDSVEFKRPNHTVGMTKSHFVIIAYTIAVVP